MKTKKETKKLKQQRKEKENKKFLYFALLREQEKEN